MNRQLRTRLVTLAAAPALAFALVVPAALSGQIGAASAAEIPQQSVTPTSGHRFDLDIGAVRSRVAHALARPGGERIDAASLRLSLVDPDGRTVPVVLQPSPVMAAGLAADHPGVVALRGSVVGHPERTVHLDVGPLGMHASVRGGSEPGFYIDPLHRVDGDRPADEAHVSYRSGALAEDQARLVEDMSGLPAEWTAAVPGAARAAAPAAPGAAVTTRVFRLAMVTDPSFAAYYGGTADGVTQAKVAIVERVNQAYLSDFSAELELIEESDDLDLRTQAAAFGSDGPCGSAPCFQTGEADSCGTALYRVPFVTGQIVGADRFDIGHVLLGNGGGGVAGHAVAGTYRKSIGCSGSPTPVGDGFAIDYVAHEIGHQVSAEHTFDGCGLDQVQPYRVEPGSGSTIMAYAGICSDDNLQSHSDPFFSAYTVTEVREFLAAELDEQADEWQTLALAGYDDDSESVTLSYPGAAATVTLTRGENFTVDGVKSALDELTGHRPVVFDLEKPFETAPDTELVEDGGFGFSFVDAGQGAGLDLPRVQVAATSTGVIARVGVLVDGGPAENGGYRTEQLGNHDPVVTAPTDLTIPVRTPFALTGSAVDPDGDTLGYLWEQTDAGGAIGPTTHSLFTNERQDGPLFRVFGTATSIDPLVSPAPSQATTTAEPTRTLPDLQQVLDGTTNATTGSCADFTAQAKVDCYSELLPTAGYARSAGSMHFRLTARDFDPAGGGIASDDLTVSLDPEAGPFLVTETPTGTIAGGSMSTVRWAVNGTAALAPQVRVTLSLDGGSTYPVDLTGPTANDGAADVVWPRTAVASARVKVEAVDNVFFDLAESTFTIVATPIPDSPDLVVPRISAVTGPANGSVASQRTVRFRFASDDPTALVSCTLDAQDRSCPNGVLELRDAPAGVRVAQAYAVDAAGNASPTVRRTVVIPHDETELKPRGSWRTRYREDALRGATVRSTTGGASLRLRVEDARRLVLIADTGPRAGSVVVWVDGRRRATMSLRERTVRHARQLVLPATRLRGRHTIRLTTLDDRHVVVDGLAVVPGSGP